MKVPGLREIFIIGSFQPSDEIARFVQQMQQEFHISIRFGCVSKRSPLTMAKKDAKKKDAQKKKILKQKKNKAK